MSNTSFQSSTQRRPPLASVQWLKYLGIVLFVLSLYVLVKFYYHYGDDVFPKSLTIGQHIKLAIFSIASMLESLFVPLLFFSGALVYHSVRFKGSNPLKSLVRDTLIIVPLGILLWVYGAYFKEPTERNFFSMIFEVQQLEPGEKLVQNQGTYDLLKMPDLKSLSKKVDTLDIQIAHIEKQFIDQLLTRIPDSIRTKVVNEIDFGSSSIKTSDILNAPSKWDGRDLDFTYLTEGTPPMISYIEEMQRQQHIYQDEITMIHLTPLYTILFMIFGLLLGYLIKLHKAALLALLIAIAYVWNFGFGVIQTSLDMNYSSNTSFLLSKIGLLIFVNVVLLILAGRIFKRSNRELHN